MLSARIPATAPLPQLLSNFSFGSSGASASFTARPESHHTRSQDVDGYDGGRDGQGTFTLRLYVAERLTPPPPTRTVIGWVPVGVVGAVVIVIVELHDGVQVTGLKEAPAPAGRPEAEKFTTWPVPDRSVALTVDVADCPCRTVPEVGFRDTEKSKAVDVE